MTETRQTQSNKTKRNTIAAHASSALSGALAFNSIANAATETKPAAPAITREANPIQKPRVIVTCDGEIDDECSMVRLLLYANERDIAIVGWSSRLISCLADSPRRNDVRH